MMVLAMVPACAVLGVEQSVWSGGALLDATDPSPGSVVCVAVLEHPVATTRPSRAAVAARRFISASNHDADLAGFGYRQKESPSQIIVIPFRANESSDEGLNDMTSAVSSDGKNLDVSF